MTILPRSVGGGRGAAAAGFLWAAAGLLLLGPAPVDAGAAHESTGWRPTAIPC